MQDQRQASARSQVLATFARGLFFAFVNHHTVSPSVDILSTIDTFTAPSPSVRKPQCGNCKCFAKRGLVKHPLRATD